MKFHVGGLCALLLLALFLGGCVNSTKTLSGQFSHLPAPKIALLHAMPSMVKGGTILTVEFQSRSTSVLGVKGQILEYSLDNGETFERIADLGPSQTRYEWLIPTVDVLEAIIRIRAFDNLAYESHVDSPTFEIKSTPPILTQTNKAANITTNGNSVLYGGACEADYHVIVEKLNAMGLYDRLGDVQCALDKWSFTVSSTTDGKFTYRISEDDPVLNHSELSVVWTRDTVPPVLTQKNVAAAVINNLNELNYGGDCETGLPVQIFIGASTAPSTQVNCVNKLWAYKATSTADGALSYSFKQTDAATNSTSVTASWTRDTVAPNLTQNVAPAASATNTPNLALGGACETGLNVVIDVTNPANNTAQYTTLCIASAWSYAYIAAADGNYKFKISQTDLATNKKSVDVAWLRDTTAPVIDPNSYKLAAGAASIITNYVPVDLDALDTYSFISHYCFKYNEDPTSTPSLSDSCWLRVDEGDDKYPLALALKMRQHFFRIGFTPATYSVQGWVRDQLGNVSKSVNATIIYNPGQPPVVVNVLAGKSDVPVLPLSQTEMIIDQGMPVVIRWKITNASNGLGSAPVSIFYTTDDVNFTSISSGVADGSNGGCSLASGLSSGCYSWNSTVPTGTYFRVRVAVTDKNGMITMVTTNPLNGNGLNSIAGNTDSGVGASATAAMFINARLGYISPDPGTFVVTNEGRVFFRDTVKGILYVNPTDGVVRVLMPLNTTAGSNTYEGPVPNPMAKVRFPTKLALDYKNGLLVHDYDRIRRVDLNTMAVKTLIGGGSSSSDGVAPTSVVFSPIGSYGRVSSVIPLVPLPNGDVLFQSGDFDMPQSKLRIFHAATNIVDSVSVSGAGHGANGSEKNVDTEDLTTCFTVVLNVSTPCRNTVFAAEFDPANSAITTLHVGIAHVVIGNTLWPLANLTPSGANIGKALAPHPPSEGSLDTSYFRVTGRNGKLYSVNQASGRISRFDKATNTWVKVVGAAGPGTCPDGTAATTCSIQPTDAFIDAQGNLFFNDRGRIRTIDGTGKVVTVYGQSFFFGDGGLAISARFNTVPALSRIGDGRVVLSDVGESRLREFMPGGNIQTIAGNGAVGIFPNTTDPASTQPYNIAGAGSQNYIFSTNPTTGDVYTNRGPNVIAKLDRATDRWVNISSSFFLGESNIGHYIPNVLGFDGTSLLIHSNGFDGSINQQVNSYIRLLKLDGTVSSFAGIAGPTTNLFCADGTPLSNCEVPLARGNWVGNATYDSSAMRWLALRPQTQAITILSTDGVTPIQTLTRVSNPAMSFAYVRKADGSQKIYYCATNGRIFQKDPVSGVESQLDWRINSMNCTGRSMAYNSEKNSLIFPYLQNSLYGIGEYTLTP